ncbi:hypothetical protein M2164_001428 [Streptomyces sp. SAI-208]|uniref:hypothetical protein n=1 Tax=unclassified Streptomyces TaxID=2593676 RepID=UPI002476C609|nr:MULTISPECIES: hypothetical protein [unclassified Streptomyces]MDH6566242.1 hypothetical protein [Streptomyces sp. SAI-117]MDH6605793.1 hypothetical protein [Streptomyces sp. SAI-208]
MELRSVDELMDLLHACGSEHALRTAALLRRSRPADKELQVAGLVMDTGQPAGVIRTLLGERVHRLVCHLGPAPDDELLRLASEESRTARFDAGVLEDWRAVLELVAARNSRLETVD